jgi:hypothetical protein
VSISITDNDGLKLCVWFTMETSRIDSVALLTAVVAIALAFTAAHGEFGYLSSIGGLTLLLVLFAYDRHGYRSGWQSLALAAVGGLCVALASGFGLALFLKPPEAPAHDFYDKWLAFAWLVATFVFTTIDRVRMSSRAPASLGLTAGSVMTPGSVMPPVVTVTPAFVPAGPAPKPAPAPKPIVEEPTPVPAAADFEPPATAVEVPPGKETEIFVNLVGEGLNVLRRVRAEHLGRDFYRIIDTMPENENWQFQPGQIVRCRKTKLSSGKSLVAFEEAPRAS